MYGKRYAGDPKWITVRYPSTCKRCAASIAKGTSAFYYPKGKALYCDTDSCGRRESRSFEAAAFDEGMLGG